MTGSEWISTAIDRVYRRNTRGLRDSAYQLYAGGWRRSGKIHNYGTPIYEEEWDLMVVIDACRADLLAEVVNEFNFLDEGTTNSVASATEEWMMKNFVPKYREEMVETTYITGNPHSSEEGEQTFEHLEEVWSHSWNDDVGTTLATDVTEYAVAAGRELNPDRCIVHYMQPHHPFVRTPELNENIGFGEKKEYNDVWEMLRKGDISRETVWKGYRENLRYVLENVATLLDNFDAERAVITSDHGNALGEFGIYGHPMFVPLPVLKRVPFCRTTATDTKTFDPSVNLSQRTVDVDVAERLGELGYT